MYKLLKEINNIVFSKNYVCNKIYSDLRSTHNNICCVKQIKNVF